MAEETTQSDDFETIFDVLLNGILREIGLPNGGPLSEEIFAVRQSAIDAFERKEPADDAVDGMIRDLFRTVGYQGLGQLDSGIYGLREMAVWQLTQGWRWND